jgi:hypothetical protein
MQKQDIEKPIERNTSDSAGSYQAETASPPMQ